ncbi:MAG: helix-turn-helix domain-containing protein [bacterium]
MADKKVNLKEAAEMLNISSNFLMECVYAQIINAERQGDKYLVPLDNIPHYINLKQTASILDVSERTVRRYVKQKKIRSYIFKTDLRFKLKDVESFIEDSKTF